MRCYVTICLYLLNKMFSVINGGLYTKKVMEASFCFFEGICMGRWRFCIYGYIKMKGGRI